MEGRMLTLVRAEQSNWAGPKDAFQIKLFRLRKSGAIPVAADLAMPIGQGYPQAIYLQIFFRILSC